ncbi:MAG: hypothetical protein AVO33_08105 [delta proteobacterium ML8_F1]|nr:MAG: hypothetical protein AVO33_08105 [delta proteobacterium ML8_F1]
MSFPQQEFDWGTIEWIYEPQDNPYNVMHIGIIKMAPGKRQNKHVHYSDEQLLYVLSGRGQQVMNDELQDLGPGMIFHMNPGDMHETINNGDEDLVELLISIPVNLNNGNIVKPGAGSRSPVSDSKNLDLRLYTEAIRSIYGNLISPLNVPISIITDAREILVKGEHFPDFCRKVCSIEEDIFNCELYNITDEYKPPYYFEHTSFVCRYGITVILIPVIVDQRILGYIRGGHVREAHRLIEVRTIHELPYERPKSSMHSLLDLMIKLQKQIVQYIESAETDQQMAQKDNQENLLKENLKNTESKMLNIQINNHFLFNTLGAIANLSLQDGAIKSYDAIIHLSKMLRYNVNAEDRVVSLGDELNYLTQYLNLQLLRFEERMNFDFDIEGNLKTQRVPFNFLQPIVENSFKHGFTNASEVMTLKISVKPAGEKMIIKISDNGAGMAAGRLERLREELKSNQGRWGGTRMVLTKLRRFYPEGVSLDIESDLGRGTRVTIVLPGGGQNA